MLPKLILLSGSIGLAFYLFQNTLYLPLSELDLSKKVTAAFLFGIMYTSVFTAPVSVVLFYLLGMELNPIVVALIGGLGSVVGDLLIVKSFRIIFKNAGDFISLKKQKQILKFIEKHNLRFLGIIFGAIIIASPVPDEIGLLMLGVSNLGYLKISLLSYVLNTLGILILLAPLYLIK